MLVDTHCHLDAKYCGQQDEVLDRARRAGVGALVCIGVGSLGAAEEAVRLAERRAEVVASVGVHPHDAAQWTPGLEQALERLAAHPEVVAVGEVGLDHHYLHSTVEEQEQVFRRFIRLARRVGKPLVIHTREAPEQTLRLLREEGAEQVGGVIHCFSEDLRFARQAFELGFDVSFSGIVTFKSAHAIQEVAATAPAERVLLETDSPYLAPVPLRGKPCEPAYVVHTARKLAELRGLELEAVAALTTDNAVRRFGGALARAVQAGHTLLG